jgi:hypothetical protein
MQTNEVLNRVVRSLLQLIAAGGATAAFEAATGLVPEQYQALVAGIFYLIVVACQNAAEEAGLIPRFMKPEPITVELIRESPGETRVL